MTRDELDRFLAQAGADSLASYLGAPQQGLDPMRALDERIAWAARAFRDQERAPEATFLMTHAAELRQVIDEGEATWRTRKALHDPFAPSDHDTSWQVTPPYLTPQVAPVRQQEADPLGDERPITDEVPLTDRPPTGRPASSGATDPGASDLPPDPGSITGSHRVEDWGHIPEFDGERAEDLLALFGPPPSAAPESPSLAPEDDPPPERKLPRALVFGAIFVLALVVGAGLTTALSAAGLLSPQPVEAAP